MKKVYINGIASTHKSSENVFICKKNTTYKDISNFLSKELSISKRIEIFIKSWMQTFVYLFKSFPSFILLISIFIISFESEVINRSILDTQNPINNIAGNFNINQSTILYIIISLAGLLLIFPQIISGDTSSIEEKVENWLQKRNIQRIYFQNTIKNLDPQKTYIIKNPFICKKLKIDFLIDSLTNNTNIEIIIRRKDTIFIQSNIIVEPYRSNTPNDYNTINFLDSEDINFLSYIKLFLEIIKPYNDKQSYLIPLPISLFKNILHIKFSKHDLESELILQTLTNDYLILETQNNIVYCNKEKISSIYTPVLSNNSIIPYIITHNNPQDTISIYITLIILHSNQSSAKEVFEKLKQIIKTSVHEELYLPYTKESLINHIIKTSPQIIKQLPIELINILLRELQNSGNYHSALQINGYFKTFYKNCYLRNLSRIHERMGDQQQALDTIIEILPKEYIFIPYKNDFYEKILSDPVFRIDLLYMTWFIITGRVSNLSKFCINSLSILEKSFLQDPLKWKPNNAWHIFNNMANYYEWVGEFDQASDYYNMSLEVIGVSQKWTSGTYANIAYLLKLKYLRELKPELLIEAQKNISISNKIKLSLSDYDELVVTYTITSEIYLLLNNFKQAKLYLDKANSISLKIGSMKYLDKRLKLQKKLDNYDYII